MAIPRTIHQTVEDKRSLHPRFVANVANLISLNPQWKHVLYDDSDIAAFISMAYPLSSGIYHIW